MFSLFDLVAPIGVTVVSVVLGIWGAIVAPEIGAKIACLALVGLTAGLTGVFYYLRWRVRFVPAYVTSHGIAVRFAEGAMRLGVNVIEDEVDKLLSFWRDKLPVGVDAAIREELATIRLTFAADEKFGVTSKGKIYMWVYGVTIDNQIYIGQTTPYSLERTRSLIRHEVSHSVLYAAGFPGETHHAIMAQHKLGA